MNTIKTIWFTKHLYYKCSNDSDVTNIRYCWPQVREERAARATIEWRQRRGYCCDTDFHVCNAPRRVTSNLLRCLKVFWKRPPIHVPVENKWTGIPSAMIIDCLLSVFQWYSTTQLLRIWINVFEPPNVLLDHDNYHKWVLYRQNNECYLSLLNPAVCHHTLHFPTLRLLAPLYILSSTGNSFRSFQNPKMLAFEIFYPRLPTVFAS